MLKVKTLLNAMAVSPPGEIDPLLLVVSELLTEINAY